MMKKVKIKIYKTIIEKKLWCYFLNCLKAVLFLGIPELIRLSNLSLNISAFQYVYVTKRSFYVTTKGLKVSMYM